MATTSPSAAVSTHSRPKAAGLFCDGKPVMFIVSTHSRPKAAGRVGAVVVVGVRVSTHSRPKAAGFAAGDGKPCQFGFNTQPPEGGW